MYELYNMYNIIIFFSRIRDSTMDFRDITMIMFCPYRKSMKKNVFYGPLAARRRRRSLFKLLVSPIEMSISKIFISTNRMRLYFILNSVLLTVL